MNEPSLGEAFETESLRAAAAAALRVLEESPIEVTRINRGNRKQTAIARFEARGPVVIQVCSERTWLRTEAALLLKIRQRTFVPVPPVLAAGTHDGVAYMLTAYVAGEDLHERFTTVSAETRRGLARWFGKALARLHEAFGFDAFGRLSVSEETSSLTADRSDFSQWFRDFGRRALARLPPAFDPVRSDLDALFDTPAVESSHPSRLFPWDFRPGNALVADGSVTAVVDWEVPLAGPPALSVAKSEYLVADWYADDPEPLRQAFRDGYAEIRNFPTVHPIHRGVAIAESAVDSSGAVTNPRYPAVGREEAIAFHLDALEAVVTEADCR